MQKNDVVELRIESVTNEGSGVGRCQGKAVFVPMTAPGDLASVKIVKVLSSYCYGIVEALLEPSPLRVQADCPVFRRCGGCSLRHMTYEGELAAKARWVDDAFRRIGGLDVPALPILPSPLVDRYRNKAQYPLAQGPDGAYFGFYAPRSHTVVPAGDCRLHPAFFGEIAKAVCRYIDESGQSVYDEATGRGLFRHLFIRHGEATGQVMVCLVISGQSVPHPERLVAAVREACPQVVSVLLNINEAKTNVILGRENRVLFGTPQIEDALCGVHVAISPQSFYQVNRRGAEALYGAAREMAGLTPTDRVLDLYCGAGTIGLSMAGLVKEVIGVEVVEAAVADARRNAAAAGIANARFFCGDAGQAAKQLLQEGAAPDVVIMDPPRKGCDRETLEAVAAMGPARVVMVSCNPATAARDAKTLTELGYAAKQVQPVEMFPRTSNVECVCLLIREDFPVDRKP